MKHDKCGEIVFKGSLVALVFILARPAASIARLVRHCFVKTQEEFQYSKILNFLLSTCERLAALSQYKTPQQHAIKKHLGRTGKNTSLHQGYSMIRNSTQLHKCSNWQLFLKVMEL